MMQYRPELGSTIGLTPQYPTERRDRDYYFTTDIANNSRQTSSYYTATRQAFEDAQRVETAHYASLPRPKDHRLPVSILSLPNTTAAATALEAVAAVPNLQRSWSAESSQSKEASESAGSDSSLESHETDLFNANPFHHSGDQPTLSSSLHNPPASSSSMKPVAVSNSSSAAVAAAVESYQMMNFEPSRNHHYHHHHHYTPEKQYEMSGEVTQMLQDLESALLEDDDDDNLPSSFYQQYCGITTSERSFWADAAFDVDMLHDAVPENTTSVPLESRLMPLQIPLSTSGAAVQQSASDATDQQHQHHNHPPVESLPDAPNTVVSLISQIPNSTVELLKLLCADSLIASPSSPSPIVVCVFASSSIGCNHCRCNSFRSFVDLSSGRNAAGLKLTLFVCLFCAPGDRRFCTARSGSPSGNQASRAVAGSMCRSSRGEQFYSSKCIDNQAEAGGVHCWRSNATSCCIHGRGTCCKDGFFWRQHLQNTQVQGATSWRLSLGDASSLSSMPILQVWVHGSKWCNCRSFSK
jgi:hypothetical protein